ncbi:MAG: ABC transporter permease [Acidimicrobiales bacterium]|nr:ABC transporter permease [Acidimicrobiales bacterium]
MSHPRASTAVASVRHFVRVVLRQIVRDRVTLFFLVVLPVVVITIIGVTFGDVGSSFDVGVVRSSTDDPAADALVDRLDATDGVGIVEFTSLDDLRGAVRRATVTLGLVFADDVEAALAAGDVAVTVVNDAGSQGAVGALDVVRAVVAAELAPGDAASFVAAIGGVDLDTATSTAESVATALPPIDVQLVDVGDSRDESLSGFSLTAPQNLVLFVFINAMAGGASLVRMRRMGVLRRVVAGPVGAADVVLGVSVAWLVVSLLQTALIMGVGALVFGVSWGSPVAAALLAIAFAAVGAGAGLLVGSLSANEDRVSSITPPVGIVLGALGGCMVPLEIFPAGMRTVSRVVPHSWAMTGWERLVFDGAGFGAVVVPILVLAGFAAVFLGAAVVALHRDLVRG